MKSPTEEPGCRKNRWQCGCWCHLSLEGPNTDDFYCYTCFIMEFTSRPWSYWDFYTYLCLFDSCFFFFFFNHAAVDVLAFLSFFLVEFLSVLLFSFGFGHFWHIWWACSRPDSVPSLNMQRLRHTILYKILHRLSSLSFNLIYPWGQYVISMHLYNAIGLSHYDLRSKGSETSYFVHFCVYKICAFI